MKAASYLWLQNMLILWRKSVDPKLKNSILIESFWELLSSLQSSLLNHTRCPVVNTQCDDKILKCNQVIMESFGGLKIFTFFFSVILQAHPYWLSCFNEKTALSVFDIRSTCEFILYSEIYSLFDETHPHERIDVEFQ